MIFGTEEAALKNEPSKKSDDKILVLVKILLWRKIEQSARKGCFPGRACFSLMQRWVNPETGQLSRGPRIDLAS